MAILKFGSVPADMDIDDGCGPTYDTSTYRSGYVRAGTILGGAYASAAGIGFYVPNTFWNSFRMRQYSDYTEGNMQPFFRLVSSTADLLRIKFSTQLGQGLVPCLYAVSGGVQTLLASGAAGYGRAVWNGGGGPISKFDIYLNYAAAGAVKVYIDGVLSLSYTGNLPAACGNGTSAAIRYSSANIGGSLGCIYSEIIVADEDTRDMDLVELYPTGEGAVSQWTGTYTAINGTTKDAVYIGSPTAGQIATYALQDFPNIIGSIKAIGVFAFAKASLAGPQSIAPVLNIAGVSYAGTFNTLTPAVMTRIQGVWDHNPTTGGAWTAADASALQAGVQSGA